MASKWTGNIARWLAQRARTASPEPAVVQETDPATANDAGAPAEAFAQARDASGQSPVAETVPPAQEPDATAPQSSAEATDETIGAKAGTGAGARPNEPDTGTFTDDGSLGEESPSTAPVPLNLSRKVLTLVSLAEHSGTKTVYAAMAGRARDKGWSLRTGGPGLTRAAFSGMLNDTDALVLIAPPDPASTSRLGEKLDWFEANNRPGLAGKTVFVINLGAAHQETNEAAGLELPADLTRPLVLLPFDSALGLSGSPARTPRRAARHALDQLVAELSTIIEEH